MEKTRIAVTGGSGRIGSEVVKQLVERGHEVWNLDKRQASNPIAKFVYIDLRQRDQVHAAFDKVEMVCHLAEIPHSGFPAPPDEIFAHNTQVGAVVMQTAADLKIKKFIYTSTCQVYGAWGPEDDRAPLKVLPMDETHPLQPRNVYSLSKVANEMYAQYIARVSQMPVAIFRFPTVWGWTKDDLQRWKRWGAENEGVPGDGLDTYLHTEDAARAYVLALEHMRPGCEAYHFSAVETVGKTSLPERTKKFLPDYPDFPKDWPPFKSPMLLDKAREHLKWEPKHNLRRDYFGVDQPKA